MPFDVAFALDPEERAAFTIIMGGFEGGEFDWRSGQWSKRDGA